MWSHRTRLSTLTQCYHLDRYPQVQHCSGDDRAQRQQRVSCLSRAWKKKDGSIKPGPNG
jgi:hypothetical protein